MLHAVRFETAADNERPFGVERLESDRVVVVVIRFMFPLIRLPVYDDVYAVLSMEGPLSERSAQSPCSTTNTNELGHDPLSVADDGGVDDWMINIILLCKLIRHSVESAINYKETALITTLPRRSVGGVIKLSHGIYCLQSHRRE